MQTKVYLADLTHTDNGIMALTFPLGTAYVAAYCSEMLKGEFDFKLFKFPNNLLKAVSEQPPSILAFSNYSWNIELSYTIASWAKAKNPDLIVIFGGPNFPTDLEEKKEFLIQRNIIDFYVQSEGEIGFHKLIEKLSLYNMNPFSLKATRTQITNCVYLEGTDLIEGNLERISDITVLPSPYLTGILDEFFDLPLTPMFETTRGCPFRCSFCADGLEVKNKVERTTSKRVREELYYIANRVKHTDEIIITDLNFGMYKQDKETAKVISELQTTFKWPVIVKGSAGKNQQERIIEIATLLKGSWIIGSAIQSSDKTVLKSINRSNISLDAYQNFLTAMKDLDKQSTTYTEIILALPGDSKKKHFESLKYALDSDVSNVKAYQAMILIGTEMATNETRRKHKLLTKYRILADGIGFYKHADEEFRVMEIQELIVGNKDMSFDDYVSCRRMNLILEGFYNNAPFGELLYSVKAMGFPIFDILNLLHDRPDLYTPRVTEIFNIYEKSTRSNLYSTYKEAKELSDDTFNLYRKGELGFNESLECRRMLYFSMEDSLTTLTTVIKEYLRKKNVLTDVLDKYFTQLKTFVLLKKNNITSFDSEFEQGFNFNFAFLDSESFNQDPRDCIALRTPITHRFFHEQSQKTHIRNSLDQYKHHSGGIARFIYSQNLKKMYRNVTAT